MSSIAPERRKSIMLPVQPHLAQCGPTRCRPVAAEDDDEVLGEPLPHLGGELAPECLATARWKSRSTELRATGSPESERFRHMPEDFLELLQKLRPVIALDA